MKDEDTFIGSRWFDACFAVVLVLVNLPAAIPIITRGGFSADDWWYEALRRYGITALHGGRPTAHPSGLFETVARFYPTTEDRPVGDVYYAVTHSAFGLHMHWYLLLTTLLTLAFGLLTYGLFRTLAFPPLHAAALGLLASVVPYADSTRYWALAGQAMLSVDLYLAGLILAVIGLRTSNSRPRMLTLLAASLACYALSVLDYQLTIGFVVLSLPVYLLSGRRPQALVAWVCHASVCIALVLYFAQFSIKTSASIDVARLKFVYGGALYVLAGTFDPYSGLVFRKPLWVELGILLAGLVALAVLRRDHPARTELRRWLALGLAAMVGWLAAYVAILPTVGYDPQTTGAGNRINAAAVLCAVCLAWAAVMVAVTLVGALIHRPRWAAWAAVVPLVALVAGDVRGLRRDQADWITAFHAQEHVLGEIARHAAAAPGNPVFTSGSALDYGGAPVFNAPFELDGAIKLELRDGAVDGIPLAPHNMVRCQRGQVWAQTWGPTPFALIGHAYMIDVNTGRALALRNAAACTRANATLTESDPPSASQAAMQPLA